MSLPRPVIITVDSLAPDPAAIATAVAALKGQGLVAFPTETVYGLGADALDAEAVANIFAAKGRPSTDPLIVHVLDLAQAESPDAHAPVVRSVPEVARLLAVAFWPGPLTLIVTRAAAVPDPVTAGLGTVAVRAPSHPVARALIHAFGGPIAAPSANAFGQVSPTRAEHVARDLGDRVDVILDAGPTAVGVESTIVDCTVTPPRVLRPGGVPLERLRRVVADLEVGADPIVTGVFKAPGQMDGHYAPRARMVLIRGANVDVRAALRLVATDLAARGMAVGLLLATEDQAAEKRWPAGVTAIVLGRMGHPAEAAHTLFDALHRLDDAGTQIILARDFGLAGMARALRDRLTRGAEGRVVRVGPGGAEAAAEEVRRMVDENC